MNCTAEDGCTWRPEGTAAPDAEAIESEDDARFETLVALAAMMFRGGVLEFDAAGSAEILARSGRGSGRSGRLSCRLGLIHVFRAKELDCGVRPKLAVLVAESICCGEALIEILHNLGDRAGHPCSDFGLDDEARLMRRGRRVDVPHSRLEHAVNDVADGNGVCNAGLEVAYAELAPGGVVRYDVLTVSALNDAPFPDSFAAYMSGPQSKRCFRRSAHLSAQRRARYFVGMVTQPKAVRVTSLSREFDEFRDGAAGCTIRNVNAENSCKLDLLFGRF